MIIYVDIDNTITYTKSTNYGEAEPNFYRISKINKLYKDGHYIVYWTARGVGSNIDYTILTTEQLKTWGCLYNELKLDKPVFDLFIDDKNQNIDYLDKL